MPIMLLLPVIVYMRAISAAWEPNSSTVPMAEQVVLSPAASPSGPHPHLLAPMQTTAYSRSESTNAAVHPDSTATVQLPPRVTMPMAPENSAVPINQTLPDADRDAQCGSSCLMKGIDTLEITEHDMKDGQSANVPAMRMHSAQLHFCAICKKPLVLCGRENNLSSLLFDASIYTPAFFEHIFLAPFGDDQLYHLNCFVNQFTGTWNVAPRNKSCQVPLALFLKHAVLFELNYPDILNQSSFARQQQAASPHMSAYLKPLSSEDAMKDLPELFRVYRLLEDAKYNIPGQETISQIIVPTLEVDLVRTYLRYTCKYLIGRFGACTEDLIAAINLDERCRRRIATYIPCMTNFQEQFCLKHRSSHFFTPCQRYCLLGQAPHRPYDDILPPDDERSYLCTCLCTILHSNFSFLKFRCKLKTIMGNLFFDEKVLAAALRHESLSGRMPYTMYMHVFFKKCITDKQLFETLYESVLEYPEHARLLFFYAKPIPIKYLLSVCDAANTAYMEQHRPGMNQVFRMLANCYFTSMHDFKLVLKLYSRCSRDLFPAEVLWRCLLRMPIRIHCPHSRPETLRDREVVNFKECLPNEEFRNLPSSQSSSALEIDSVVFQTASVLLSARETMLKLLYSDVQLHALLVEVVAIAPLPDLITNSCLRNNLTFYPKQVIQSLIRIEHANPRRPLGAYLFRIIPVYVLKEIYIPLLTSNALHEDDFDICAEMIPISPPSGETINELIASLVQTNSIVMINRAVKIIKTCPKELLAAIPVGIWLRLQNVDPSISQKYLQLANSTYRLIY